MSSKQKKKYLLQFDNIIDGIYNKFVMKTYFKNPVHLTIFIIFLVSLLFPLVSFGGDAVAYCMGYHHGFTQPWPTIRITLKVLFLIVAVTFVVDIIVYNILKSKKMPNQQ